MQEIITKSCTGALLLAALGGGAGVARAADAIENQFAATGAWAVTWDDGRPGGCAAGGVPSQPYTMVYPSALGAFGVDHPIVV